MTARRTLAGNTHLQDEITERTRIEQVLRVGEEQYRLLAEHVKDGIVIIRQEHIVFANAGFTLMVGCPKEELFQLEPGAPVF